MSDARRYGTSFRHKLSLTFAGSALVLLFAGGFALYLMSQLSTAVERALSEILPQTLVAMRLSENSALLVASAPSMTNARNSVETDKVAADLDALRVEIERNLATLGEGVMWGGLEQVRANVATLANTLSVLKEATNERIALSGLHAAATNQIRQVHSGFSDTVSPVVWGVSSLTRLFGKRAARTNVAAIKTLRDRHVGPLLGLLRLQIALRELLEPAITAGGKNFDSAWKQVRTLLQDPAGPEYPLRRELLVAGERFSADRARFQGRALARPDPRFEGLLTSTLAAARAGLAQQFSTAEQVADSSIAGFVEQSARDMGYALDIKAEGNLLFALLTATADANTPASVSSLQDRFRRSRSIFLNSTTDFLNSELSRRNPVLATNVADLEKRLRLLGDGPDNLFDIRRRQLAVDLRISQLLATNRKLATLLKDEVDGLVNEVQQKAAAIGARLQRNRGVSRFLLVLVFLAGLLLLLAIAIYSIRMLEKQEREIRRAAMVFESTGESIVIADRQSRIVAVNQAFVDAYGYQRDEVIGRHIRTLRSKRQSRVFYKQVMEVLAREGRWQGEIYTRRKSGDSSLEWMTVNAIRDDLGNVSQYVAVFSGIAMIKRSLQQLDHIAHHDTLTGLPNRLLLQDRLDHAIHRAHREKRRLAVLFLDLDRFKNINDTLGHGVGDQLLRIFAARLTKRVREGDTVARLGGDEFMILLEGYKEPEDARTVARELLDTLGRAFHIQGHDLFVSASIGISLYPDDGVNADELVRNSDAAMYRAKEKGKNTYQFYTSDLTVAARENLRLESELRLALERREFVLYYQPKWNIDSGCITGVEALLRWQHPGRGLIGPAEFLDTLEDCGLILPVGRWVLLAACRQAQAWQDQGLPAIQMSVNLSGRQIVDGSLLQDVTDSIEGSGLDARCLELELTEGFVMQQPEDVVLLLNSLRAMQVSIAIDDFGTGHSSLSYLKQLPVQKLKIDRSFVRDIPLDADDMAITSAIIGLGHKLQLSIVAEGVETDEQIEFLIAEGCEEAQGYLFSVPLPAQEVSALLTQGYFGVARRVSS